MSHGLTTDIVAWYNSSKEVARMKYANLMLIIGVLYLGVDTMGGALFQADPAPLPAKARIVPTAVIQRAQTAPSLPRLVGPDYTVPSATGPRTRYLKPCPGAPLAWYVFDGMARWQDTWPTPSWTAQDPALPSCNVCHLPWNIAGRSPVSACSPCNRCHSTCSLRLTGGRGPAQ